MIVDRGVAAQWLREAKAGETLVYARVTSLPVASVVAQMMRDAAAAGYVTLYQRRRETGGGNENFFYVARRNGVAKHDFSKLAASAAPPLSAQAVNVSSCAAIAQDIAPQVRSMLAEGERPNASAIARQLGIYSSYPVARVLRQIERMAA